MTLTRRPRYRMIALVVLGLMLGTATFSFAAGGTIASPGPTGEYLELESFQALDVVYHLDPQNPRVLEQVQFNTKGQSAAVAAGLEFQGEVMWFGWIVFPEKSMIMLVISANFLPWWLK